MHKRNAILLLAIHVQSVILLLHVECLWNVLQDLCSHWRETRWVWCRVKGPVASTIYG